MPAVPTQPSEEDIYINSEIMEVSVWKSWWVSAYDSFEGVSLWVCVCECAYTGSGLMKREKGYDE